MPFSLTSTFLANYPADRDITFYPRIPRKNRDVISVLDILGHLCTRHPHRRRAVVRLDSTSRADVTF